jgi:hypothetical protein
MATPITDTLNELDLVKRSCLNLLEDLRRFHPAAPGSNAYPETYRLLVIPLLYAAWERCFTLCNAIAWRRLREECPAAANLKSTERAAWLMQAGFYQSFAKKLLNAAGAAEEDTRPKRSHFPTLAEFLGELDKWSSLPLDQSVQTNSLVMTFSNVNVDVVTLNAEALGISNFPAFGEIKFGRLHSLVGHRNNIGHGGTLAAPDNSEFTELWDFTERLIEVYSETFKSWICARFPPPLPPPTKAQRLLQIGREFLRTLPHSRAPTCRVPILSASERSWVALGYRVRTNLAQTQLQSFPSRAAGVRSFPQDTLVTSDGDMGGKG